MSKALAYILFIVLFGIEATISASHFANIAALQAWQLAALGFASFRGGRTISYNGVFAWLRAPFCVTAPDGSGAGDSVNPRPNKNPFLFAVGDLLACPICTGTHVAGVLLSLIALWPELGIVVLYGLAAAGIAESLNWYAERNEWMGRAAREYAGSQCQAKQPDPLFEAESKQWEKALAANWGPK